MYQAPQRSVASLAVPCTRRGGRTRLSDRRHHAWLVTGLGIADYSWTGRLPTESRGRSDRTCFFVLLAKGSPSCHEVNQRRSQRSRQRGFSGGTAQLSLAQSGVFGTHLSSQWNLGNVLTSAKGGGVLTRRDPLLRQTLSNLDFWLPPKNPFTDDALLLFPKRHCHQPPARNFHEWFYAQ
jgi:hypothetical protein